MNINKLKFYITESIINVCFMDKNVAFWKNVSQS